MPRLQTILLLALIGLAACSPGDHSAQATQAKKPAAAHAADTGQTPLPVQNVGRADLFHGYRCDMDCSIHQAGYAWASVHKIANPKDCKGTSQEFIEGCLAFTGIDGPLGEREIFQDED